MTTDLILRNIFVYVVLSDRALRYLKLAAFNQKSVLIG